MIRAPGPEGGPRDAQVPHPGVARRGDEAGRGPARAPGGVGPDGDVKYYWVLENGKLQENKLGDISDADFTLTLTYDDSVKVQKGELDANAAFMQGRMKVTGNMGKLMQLMPLTNSP